MSKEVPRRRMYILNRLTLKVIGFTLVAFLMSTRAGLADTIWDAYSDEQIVEAIGKAENSVKYPYGIKSIDTKGNKEYARKICLNSVWNGRARWVKAGKPHDLITFIGLRYCPPNAHILNTNWVRNVKFFLKRGE